MPQATPVSRLLCYIADTCNLCDIAFRLERGQKVVQMFLVPQLDLDLDAIEVGLAVLEFKVRDIGPLRADQPADAAQDACVVADRQ